jgi:hypothetical protein
MGSDVRSKNAVFWCMTTSLKGGLFMQSQRMVLCKPKFTLLLFMCAIMFSFVNTWAYTPPIGIPDPGMWGSIHPIDSSAPSTTTKCPNWPNSASTGCYYIDNSVACSDATDGYPSSPRCTIPTGTYSAGSYVEIHGGPYILDMSIVLNGTYDNPVWFRGVSADSMPDYRGKIEINNSTYAIIENIDINNVVSGGITLSGSMNAHHVSIRNCKFRNFTGISGAVCGATPIQDGTINNIVYYNNYFDTIGNWQAVEDEDYHAINPSLWGRTPPTTVYNIWSLSNTAYHIAGSLNQFNGDQRDATRAVSEGRTETNLQNLHHVYSGKNLMYNCRQAMGAPKFTTDAIYSQNVAYSNFSIASGAGSGQVYQEGSRYVWILFNKYYDLTYGIRSSNTSFPGDATADLRAYMIGNVIYNIHNNHNRAYSRTNTYKPAQAIGFEKALYKRYIVDNTFYNVGGGVNIGNQVAADITGLSGNVFAGINGIDDAGDPDYHLSMLSTGGTTGTTIDRCFFQPRADTGLVTFKWAGAEPSSNINSLADLQSSSVAQCQNCWTGDPLFVDTANYDLHPKENSPLVGKGIRHPIYDEFQARYGINIAYDFDGKPRPVGAWTLGALEPGTLKTSPLPTPPAPKATDIK